MLGLSLHEYTKLDGRNDYTQQQTTQQHNKVLDVIFRVAKEHDNFPIDELINLVEKENIVLRYFLNENNNVKDDKKAQNLICAILNYEEEEIDTILSELDCSE